ncbi:acyltransferase [Stutzerimonas nitrititolerans]|uniref:acyltransferase n=1 Tax=Stutzerimonas nitrititolerans TaxID=2482751 RepID=UPI0028A2C538|nr:acyltransferase [Stutzerimonas nitrititolerans]
MVRKILARGLGPFFPRLRAKLLGVKFGEGCKFNKKVIWGSEPYLISIGNYFYCSAYVSFITHDGSVNVLRNLSKSYKDCDYFAPILLGHNIFLGYGVVVMPGSVIGDNVIVGACSLVKGELASNMVYAGTPAKPICTLEEYENKYGEKLFKTKGWSADRKKKYLQAIFARVPS